jgi:hypothetical protein
MHAVLAVAGATSAGGADLRGRAHRVAGMTRQRTVCAGQGVADLLVVVKPPARPAVHNPMAGLAGDGGVQADEGKPRQVVVKGRRLAPARLLVAGPAGRPKLALVGMILVVAGGAVGRRAVVPGVAAVAAFTGELGMAAAQGEPRRLVVIEAYGSPFCRGVAGLAGAAIATRVFVLQAVTAAAGGGQALVALAGVALAIGDLLVGADQREPRLAVIEGFHAPPGLLAVTGFALLAQPAFAGVDRPVAVEAAPGRLAVFRVLYMAGVAACAFVRPCQGEIGKSVVEGFAIELNDVEGAPLVFAVTGLALALDRFGVAAG